MHPYKYYIFGYSDYIKNSLNDILLMPNVRYYDVYRSGNRIHNIIQRIFVSRYASFLSYFLMPFCKNLYWKGEPPDLDEPSVLILYEINPLSNKQAWISQMKKKYPKLRVVYIFTNIIDEHRMWRIKQINKRRELYDLVLTFNKADADKYGMGYYEGVFSPKSIDLRLIEQAEASDVYFCGLDKGRLPQIISIYDYLSANGVKCKFDIIYTKESDRLQREGVRYHDDLLKNDVMLANVIKSKCILEVMVDRSQPGSSLRMCESIAYSKKLLTNNPFAQDKPFFIPKQMRYFDVPEDIDIEFICDDLDEGDYADKRLLSPVRLLDYIEGHIDKQ